MDTKQLEALLRLADAYADASFEQGLEKRTLDDAPENARSALETELRRLHAENETLRTGYNAARLEIASLHTQMDAVGAGGHGAAAQARVFAPDQRA